jgi:O-antigen ligase
MVAILAGLLFIGTTGRVREVRRIAITGIVLAALGALALPATYKERMSSMGEEVDNTSPSARINVWKRGIGYTFDNPIFGVGIGNFGRAEGILSDYSQSKGGRGVKWSTAHSSYIQTFAELGIIGGLAFSIAVIGGTLALLWWRPPGWLVDPAQRMLTPMVGLSLGAFAVSGAFLSFAYASPPYYLLGFATALLLPGTLHGNRSAMPGGMSSTTQSPLRRRPVQSQFSRYPAPPPPRLRH